MEKERIRKRPRLGWDVGPSESEAQRSSVVDGNQWTEKHVSPPRRDDDREGHFVFSLGDNLTPRYMHDLQMIHTDLKPENILLVSSDHIRLPASKGEALFQMHENLEHLAMMEKVLGPLPKHMICKANQGAEKYFRRSSRLNWPEGAVSRESIKAVKKLESLKVQILSLTLCITL
ncbi:Serine/threonine-protein kinase AFC3 [Linum grandiflorum]